MMTAHKPQYGVSLQLLLHGLGTGLAVPDVQIQTLALDSRRVQPGSLFLACKGSRQDGRTFIPAAIRAGAVAVAVEDDIPEFIRQAATAVPLVVVPKLAQQLSEIAARFYAQPAQALTITGITGTNGKTSVSHFVAALLNACYGSCGLFGTLGYGRYGDLQPATTTTPDPITLQALLAELRDAGTTHAVMEVSSHALVQGRVNAVPFDTAVLTNISRDHLDYHADMAAYAAAKRRLFEQPELRHRILNVDDAYGRAWTQAFAIERSTTANNDIVTYGMQSGADVHGELLRESRAGMQLHLTTPWGQAQVDVPLAGRFNIANVLAAVTVAVLQGMPFAAVCAGVGRLQAPAGRMQRFVHDQQPLVVIDYAHTPDALAQVLQALRPQTRGQLWCVFGCGGDRDAGKRPLMGQAAQEYADRVVVTSDNPRTEDPEKILAEIVTGMSTLQHVMREMDRAAAIRQTIAQAGADDVVLIAGKGHEQYQEIAGQRLPFSDQEVVQTCLQRTS